MGSVARRMESTTLTPNNVLAALTTTAALLVLHAVRRQRLDTLAYYVLGALHAAALALALAARRGHERARDENADDSAAAYGAPAAASTPATPSDGAPSPPPPPPTDDDAEYEPFEPPSSAIRNVDSYASDIVMSVDEYESLREKKKKKQPSSSRSATIRSSRRQSLRVSPKKVSFNLTRVIPRCARACPRRLHGTLTECALAPLTGRSLHARCVALGLSDSLKLGDSRARGDAQAMASVDCSRI